mgnify:FL=1
MRTFNKGRAQRTLAAVIRAAKKMRSTYHSTTARSLSHEKRVKARRRFEKAKAAYAIAVRKHGATL